jgi:hypothetical protein
VVPNGNYITAYNLSLTGQRANNKRGGLFSAEGVLCFSAIPLRKTASKKPIFQNKVKRAYNNFTALVVYVN